MVQPRARTQIYWRDDIESIMRSIDRSNAQLVAALPLEQVTIYRAGFRGALQAVATAVGVNLDSPDAPTPATERLMLAEVRR
jgi:hypothetical protein